MAHKSARVGKRIAVGAFLVAILCASAMLFGWMRNVARCSEPDKRLLAALQGYEYLGRDRVVFQRGAIDCGPAAMEMVLKHYGIKESLESLEREMLNDPKGTTMERMKLVAERYGLLAEGRRIDAIALRNISLPLIALYERRHYVVVVERTPNGYLTILDPALGRCRTHERSFIRACHGEILIIEKPH